MGRRQTRGEKKLKEEKCEERGRERGKKHIAHSRMLLGLKH